MSKYIKRTSLHKHGLASASPHSTARGNSRLLGSILSLAIGLAIDFEYNLIGVLKVSEMLVVAVVPLVVLTGGARGVTKLPYVKLLFSLGLLWLASQTISDVFNQTETTNMLKGHANIGMIIASTCGFVMLFQPNPNRYVWYLVGRFISRFGNSIVGALSMRGAPEYWDRYIAGWAFTLLFLVSLYLVRRKKRPLTILFLFSIYAAAAIANGGRSHGLVAAMTGAAYWYGATYCGVHFRNLSRKTIWNVAASLFVVLILLFYAFAYLGVNGHLTEKTKRQLIASGSPYNPVAVILAGRGGTAIAMQAIADKPIFGHGSKAFNPKYIPRAMYSRSAEKLTEIPTHSIILAAWVFSGILGIPVWIAVLIVHAKILDRAMDSSNLAFLLLASWCLSSSMWNILFSPFGYARFGWPPIFAVCVVLAGNTQRLSIRRERKSINNPLPTATTR